MALMMWPVMALAQRAALVMAIKLRARQPRLQNSAYRIPYVKLAPRWTSLHHLPFSARPYRGRSRAVTSSALLRLALARQLPLRSRCSTSCSRLHSQSSAWSSRPPVSSPFRLASSSKRWGRRSVSSAPSQLAASIWWPRPLCSPSGHMWWSARLGGWWTTCRTQRGFRCVPSSISSSTKPTSSSIWTLRRSSTSSSMRAPRSATHSSSPQQ
mmetsp:Transcript_2733/g.7567  ORF Transcript_2733/g.7567 Transcript_2733/m.7567 type:complete len:212 (+) Transcript_2733:132-767(+)